MARARTEQRTPSGVALNIVCAAALSLALLCCTREDRRFHEPPPATGRANATAMTELHAGEPPAVTTSNIYEENAWAVSQGKRFYQWFNCVGCHGHGGGSIGPPLMDDHWIYGSDPANIVATILEGRPNGMPSFRGKIPDYQVWQIAAYVRALAGLLDRDVAPGRDDNMYVKQQEQSKSPDPPDSAHKSSSIPEKR
jgi:cytochrome c oxidase cbb3-type subunit III